MPIANDSSAVLRVVVTTASAAARKRFRHRIHHSG